MNIDPFFPCVDTFARRGCVLSMSTDRIYSSIVTHPGGAHKDEFLACCVLLAEHAVPLFRREPSEADLADALPRRHQGARTQRGVDVVQVGVDGDHVPHTVHHPVVDDHVAAEVHPYVPDAWVDHTKTKIGYEIPFTRHFYKPPVLRSLAQISADILALEQETEGLLSEITGGTAA